MIRHQIHSPKILPLTKIAPTTPKHAQRNIRRRKQSTYTAGEVQVSTEDDADTPPNHAGNVIKCKGAETLIYLQLKPRGVYGTKFRIKRTATGCLPQTV